MKAKIDAAHRKIDMKHSFCPVCFEAGKQEMIELLEKKGIKCHDYANYSGDLTILFEDWQALKENIIGKKEVKG